MKIKTLAGGLLAAGLAFGLAACGSSTHINTQPVAASALTATGIAAQLGPLGCNATPDTETAIGVQPQTALTCTVNGEIITIDDYVNHQQVMSAVNTGRTVGCPLLEAVGVTDPSYVVTSKSTVLTDTAPTAQLIRNTLGGDATVNTIHCG